MQKKVSIIIAIVGWFAVISQFVLMLNNRTTAIDEMIIRFFSFFTILTNTLVALFFTFNAYKKIPGIFSILKKPGALTAITVYITIVGLVYQIALRHIWNPAGMQMVVDELLHTIIPLTVIGFWHFFEKKEVLKYKMIWYWLLYPFLYLAIILIRGKLSGFYPYPFVDVNTLGFGKVLLNSILLMGLFVVISYLYITIGRLKKRLTNIE